MYFFSDGGTNDWGYKITITPIMPEQADEDNEDENDKDDGTSTGDVVVKEGEEMARSLSEKSLSIHKSVVLNTHPFYIGQPPFYTASPSTAPYCGVSTTALIGLLRVHSQSLTQTHVHTLFTQELRSFTNPPSEQKQGLARGQGLAPPSGPGLALTKYLSPSSSALSLRRSLSNISSKDCMAGELECLSALALLMRGLRSLEDRLDDAVR